MKHSSVSLWPQNQEEEPQHGLINNRRVVSDVDILEFRKERQQKQKKKKKKLPLSRDFEEETERHDVTFFLSFSCHDSLKDSVVLVLHSLLSTLVLLTHHLRRRLKSRRLSDNMCVTYLCYPLLTAYTLHQKVSVDEQPSFFVLVSPLARHPSLHDKNIVMSRPFALFRLFFLCRLHSRKTKCIVTDLCLSIHLFYPVFSQNTLSFQLFLIFYALHTEKAIHLWAFRVSSGVMITTSKWS